LRRRWPGLVSLGLADCFFGAVTAAAAARNHILLSWLVVLIAGVIVGVRIVWVQSRLQNKGDRLTGPFIAFSNDPLAAVLTIRRGRSSLAGVLDVDLSRASAQNGLVARGRGAGIRARTWRLSSSLSMQLARGRGDPGMRVDGNRDGNRGEYGERWRMSANDKLVT
jgi:hypothetical protein